MRRPSASILSIFLRGPESVAKKVLIIRLSAIGDVVFASPLIMSVRRRWPEAHIAWLVEPAAAPLLQANPALDEVISWPKAEWKALWKARQYRALWRVVTKFRRELRAKQFDLVLDVQGLLKSALMAWFTGASQRLALDSGEPTGLLVTAKLEKPSSDRIGSEYLAFAQWADLDTGDFAMSLVLSDGAQAVRQAEQDRGDYVVLCPFTTRPQKHWRDDGWRQLAHRLSERGYRVLLLGGPGDIEAARGIVDGTLLESRVGAARLDETAALIAGASALIGVDTGLTHMGITFGVPTVALFGSTCPYRRTTRANARVIYHDLPCAPCRRNPTCDGRFDCLAGITAEEVLQELERAMTADAALLIEPV
jgi:heptosyltransferase-1